MDLQKQIKITSYMNNSECISIIIPCYNAEQTLKKCLDSVAHQDYSNIEIIIVDDGSTDDSVKIYEEFHHKDERIKVIKQNNSGVSKARNTGVNAATSNYICFVDSDDWVEKNYCSELYRLLIDENADISVADVIYEDESGNPAFRQAFNSEVHTYRRQKALELLLEDKVIKSYPCAKLFKKDTIKNISFPEHLEAFEDYFSLFKIFDNADKVVKANQPLYHYIQFPNSLSHHLTPKRAFHFFTALMEAFHFLQSRKIDKKYENPILKNILKKSFMVLKRMIRNTNPEEMLTEKEIIRKKLMLFLQYSVFSIGIENYIYLRFFINFPRKYMQFVKK